jgi:outer membrane protein assembly factor BamA
MEFSRRRSAATAFLAAAAALLLLLPGSVLAETKYFPLPAVGTTKNDGSDVGLIMPTLVTKPDGDLHYLVAPMLIYNTIVGARGSLNVFHYEPGGRELRFVGSISERIERKLLLSYIDPAFGNGRYALSFGGTFFKNATARFFGLGPSTSQGEETNYTAREIRAHWKFGLHMNEVTQIAIGQRYRDMQLQPGAVDLPYTLNVFPTVVGGQGAKILGHRATFHYDTRDNLVSPTDGSQVTAYAELNQNLDNDIHPVFYRYELEGKKLFPNGSKRMILVVRGDIQLTFGNQVPFYEQSSLGGQNNLRGYGVDRFIDKHLVVLNIEERIHVLRAKFLNVAAELEIAPFVDIGRVFNTFETEILTNYRVTPGIGFRAMVRPNVVGRVDYGYSKEGGAVFAGLDYPF